MANFLVVSVRGAVSKDQTKKGMLVVGCKTKLWQIRGLPVEGLLEVL